MDISIVLKGDFWGKILLGVIKIPGEVIGSTCHIMNTLRDGHAHFFGDEFGKLGLASDQLINNGAEGFDATSYAELFPGRESLTGSLDGLGDLSGS